MIISHKYKFIFIKTRKTAGTSLEMYLSQYCGSNDIVTRFGIETKGHEPRNFDGFDDPHISCKEIKSKISPEIWNEYYKFTFERNPWDKMVSWFWHQGTVIDILKDLTFEEFCNKCKDGLHTIPTDFEKYTIDGKICVDFIGKYENLLEDLNSVCQKLGLPFEPPLPRLKSEFKINKNHYSNFYNESTKKFVQSIFSKEIEHFGYFFETNLIS